MTLGNTEMALAQPDVGNEQHVGLVGDELQTEQMLDLGPVDLLRPAPIELVDGLEHREAGQPHPALHTAVFAPAGFTFGQPRQIVEVRPLLGSGFRIAVTVTKPSAPCQARTLRRGELRIFSEERSMPVPFRCPAWCPARNVGPLGSPMWLSPAPEHGTGKIELARFNNGRTKHTWQTTQ